MAVMITIRFPSGFSVRYNGATCASNPDSDGIVRLYSSDADPSAAVNVIARCPRECILEYHFLLAVLTMPHEKNLNRN